MNSRKTAQLAKKFFGDIKQNLNKNSNGLSESDILRKFMEFPRQNADKIERNEEAFKTHIWPLLEQHRKKDK